MEEEQEGEYEGRKDQSQEERQKKVRAMAGGEGKEEKKQADGKACRQEGVHAGGTAGRRSEEA